MGAFGIAETQQGNSNGCVWYSRNAARVRLDLGGGWWRDSYGGGKWRLLEVVWDGDDVAVVVVVVSHGWGWFGVGDGVRCGDDDVATVEEGGWRSDVVVAGQKSAGAKPEKMRGDGGYVLNELT
ncbi:hypothetical protein Tco_0331405 [Tanacetum coccineum]